MDGSVWARRKALHSSPETYGTRCDGCPELDCIETERSRLHRWRYYCGAMGKGMELRDLYEVTQDDCPLGREIKRRIR